MISLIKDFVAEGALKKKKIIGTRYLVASNAMASNRDHTFLDAQLSEIMRCNLKKWIRKCRFSFVDAPSPSPVKLKLFVC